MFTPAIPPQGPIYISWLLNLSSMEKPYVSPIQICTAVAGGRAGRRRRVHTSSTSRLHRLSRHKEHRYIIKFRGIFANLCWSSRHRLRLLWLLFAHRSLLLSVHGASRLDGRSCPQPAKRIRDFAQPESYAVTGSRASLASPAQRRLQLLVANRWVQGATTLVQLRAAPPA